MNEQQLFDYLDRHYVLKGSNIVHEYYGDKDYGKHIAEEMSLIFSVEFTIVQKIVMDWISNKLENIGELEKFWVKQNGFSYYEPKRPNRFLIIFPEEFEIPQYLVKSTIRPSVTVNNGFMQWEDIEITFIDPVSPSTAQILHELFLRVESLFFNRPFQYRLQMLGPVGDVVEEWTILGSMTQIDFGNLNYDSDELMEIKLTIRPINCVLNF